MPNAHILEVIFTLTSYMETSSDDPRKKLHSRANMVFLGSNSFVFESTRRTCNFQPFTSDLAMEKDVTIVDGDLVYDCSCTGKVCALVVRNTFHVPSMGYDLITPCTMRADSVIVHEVPKIHCEDPAIDDHCVLFEL